MARPSDPQAMTPRKPGRTRTAPPQVPDDFWTQPRMRTYLLFDATGIVYLFGANAALPYRLLWLVFIYLGAVGSLHLVWDIADTLNGLMAIPNLLSVLVSIPVLLKLKREFFAAEAARR